MSEVVSKCIANTIFVWGHVCEISERDRFHADLDESLRAYLCASVAARQLISVSRFRRIRADPKVMKTSLRVGHGCNCAIVKEWSTSDREGHQVSSSRSGFGHQVVSYCCNALGSLPAGLLLNIILSLHFRRDEDCYPQKRTSPHTPPRVRPGGKPNRQEHRLPHMGISSLSVEIISLIAIDYGLDIKRVNRTSRTQRYSLERHSIRNTK